MGPRLRILREAHGIGAKVAANKLRIGYHALNKYELGERRADFDVIIRFSEYYHVPIEFLFLGPQASDTAMPRPRKVPSLVRR